MRISVAQLGARMHYAIPRIFSTADILERFFTDTYIGNKPGLVAGCKAIPQSIRPKALARLLGREDQYIPKERVTSFDFLGYNYQRKLRSARSHTQRMHIHAKFAGRFCQNIALHRLGASDAIWAFNGAALELFIAAKAQGLRCIMEQTMAPYRVHDDLMLSEKKLWPGWQPGLELDGRNNPLADREEAEWQLADIIICGSKFVVDGIAACGGPAEKCRVVPYGVDLGRFPYRPRRMRSKGDKLRIAYAGEVGLRKGTPYLLEALKSVGSKKVEARFAGRIVLAHDKIELFKDVATFYGSVPRSEIGKLFEWADVFVLPSVCEGSATVTYEAVASGLPVLCSLGAGALESSAVKVMDCRAPEALADVLLAFLRESERFNEVDQVRNLYGLDTYAERLIHTLKRQVS